MNVENRNLLTSLRCLQYPAAWFSIALLLMNNYVLKAVSRSGITGKLSDLCGSFFFPSFLR